MRKEDITSTKTKDLNQFRSSNFKYCSDNPCLTVRTSGDRRQQMSFIKVGATSYKE